MKAALLQFAAAAALAVLSCLMQVAVPRGLVFLVDRLNAAYFF